MKHKEISLAKNINSIKIYASAANIIIHPAMISTPIIKSNSEIDILCKDKKVIIQEKKSNQAISINHSSHSNFHIHNMCINNQHGTVVFGNGNVLTKSNNFQTTEEIEVELFVPYEHPIQSYDIHTQSGNLTIEKLAIDQLVAETTSGNITLDDIDLLLGKLETINGNINVQILESYLNYRTRLSSTCGCINEDTIETAIPTRANEEHLLDAETISGDINILFKGKK